MKLVLARIPPRLHQANFGALSCIRHISLVHSHTASMSASRNST